MEQSKENNTIGDRLQAERRFVVPENAILDVMCVLSVQEHCYSWLSEQQQRDLAAIRHLPVCLMEYLSQVLGIPMNELELRLNLRLTELKAGIIGDYRI